MTAGRSSRETIFALSSARGRAGVAVVRLSGPLAPLALARLTGSCPAPRRAVLRRLRDGSGTDIDHGLVLWFPAPSSFTGEDMVELQVHGGRAILDALFRTLEASGLRPAEPGEFTRRAVENGKLDLTRAEAIADLVGAETESQRRQALRQYCGEQAHLYDGWRQGLIRATAWLEAAIDFADEEVPEDLWRKGLAVAQEIASEIQTHRNDSRRGELVREGLYLTVIGPPNAGKSSLLNALARRDIAIVSEIAGTTRDVIETRLDIEGYPIIVADTAGLRSSAETIEQEGVRRALERAGTADIILLLLDGSLADPFDGVPLELTRSATLTVWNKVDLRWPQGHDGLKLSLKTGEGLPELLSAIAAEARLRIEAPMESVALTHARYRVSLVAAEAAVRRAEGAVLPELCAEDLRLAVREIGRITGHVDVEDLLEVVFRDFCIGK